MGRSLPSLQEPCRVQQVCRNTGEENVQQVTTKTKKQQPHQTRKEEAKQEEKALDARTHAQCITCRRRCYAHSHTVVPQTRAHQPTQQSSSRHTPYQKQSGLNPDYVRP